MFLSLCMKPVPALLRFNCVASYLFPAYVLVRFCSSQRLRIIYMYIHVHVPVNWCEFNSNRRCNASLSNVHINGDWLFARHFIKRPISKELVTFGQIIDWVLAVRQKLLPDVYLWQVVSIVRFPVSLSCDSLVGFWRRHSVAHSSVCLNVSFAQCCICCRKLTICLCLCQEIVFQFIKYYMGSVNLYR